MAQLAGLDLETRHADWTGTDFSAKSRSHISIYRLGIQPPGLTRPLNVRALDRYWRLLSLDGGAAVTYGTARA